MGAQSRRNHLVSLDGLRGFAAISVVAFHLGHWLHMPALAANSSLAVDLFFCLSGYVLPLAYGQRSTSLSLTGFMRLRLLRLMPLIVLATAISALYLLSRRAHMNEDIPLRAIATAVLFGLLNLPYFDAPKAIGGPELFPLNGPQYSLFLELVVNLLWWTTRQIDQFRLAIFLALACFACLPAMGLGGDLPETFWSGFPRVGASFFAGVAIFHLAGRLPTGQGWTVAFWLLAATMAVLFYLPFELALGWQLVWVGVLSPLLVLAGAKTVIDGFVARLCMVGGGLSYPIYCLHYPLFCWINGAYRTRFGDQNIGAEGPLVMVLVFILSFALLQGYDQPVRRMLGRRIRHRSSQAST